jgi:hypothetical protein
MSVQIVHVREWLPRKGAALDSDATFGEIAADLGEYGSPSLWQDQWSFDSNKAIAERHGIELHEEAMTQPRKVQLFEALRRRVVDGTIELPDVPQVRADLCGVRKWVGKGGNFSIELERVGSRHADHAMSIALVVDKIATDGGEPGWMRAMSAWRARGYR